MAHAEIPRIQNLPDAVLQGVGEHVQVFLRVDDPSMGPIRRSSHEMVRDVVSDMFMKQGVTPNHDLEVLCVLAARIAVGKIATSNGFDIEFGDYIEPPHKIVRVDLGRKEAPRQATVTQSE